MKRVKWGQLLGGLVLGLLVAVGWYFLDCPPPAYQLSDDRPYPVYVFFYSWHSAIAWEQKHLPPDLRGMGAEQWRNAPIVEFGWGDRAFFWGGDQSWLSILRIIFTSSPSVMHVASFNSLPPRPYQVVCVDQEGLIRLRNFIASSFHRQRVLGQGHYGVSNFYEAIPAYSLWFNCNSWTAQALRHAGIRLCPRQIFTVEQLRELLPTTSPATPVGTPDRSVRLSRRDYCRG